MPIKRLSNQHFGMNILRYKFCAKRNLDYLKIVVLTSYLNFLKHFGRITAHNFVQINIITPNHAYYEIIRLQHQYEYSMTLILRKT